MKICLLTAFTLAVSMVSAMKGRSLNSVRGISNCHNKCNKVFDRTQYAINDQPGQNTFEYRACILGCNRCVTELGDSTTQQDQCFDYCKKLDYSAIGIRKGVIEPDKACLMGCVINTCQQVCFGGTTDWVQTPANAQFFWNGGGHGCSIKGMLGYIQNPNYVNPDAPSGAGASDAQRQCCANAFNLCEYDPSAVDAANFANVVLVTQRTCKSLVGATDTNAICNWFNNPQNCGTPGLNPV